MKNAMTTAGHPLAITPKMEVGQNYLRLADDITDEELRQIDLALHRVESTRQWIVGDFAREVRRVRPRVGDEPEQLVLLEIEEQASVKLAVEVCDYFAPEDRVEGMSFAHHRAAWEELSEDQEAALVWLEKARVNDWTVPQLRAGIRQAASSQHREERTNIGAAQLEKLYAVVPVCKRLDPGSLSPEQRRALRKDLEPVVEWWRRL